MELVGRMLDGSISYSGVRGALHRTGLFGSRVTQDTKMERLQEIPLFEGCTRGQLRSVARIADVVEVAAGTQLTRVGDHGEAFFLILDGRVRVDVSSRKRVRQGPGEFFGEMSLLDGGPRSATVVADTDVRLLVIARRDFSLLLTKVPDLTRHLLVVLTQRLRQAEQTPTA
jgi:CRP/FNR family transcriptional regulator, cyclic AMP receptor protein